MKIRYFKYLDISRRAKPDPERVWCIFALREDGMEKCLWSLCNDPTIDTGMDTWHNPHDEGENTIAELMEDPDQGHLWFEIDKAEAFRHCL